jgi:hypothetical protein
MSSAHGITKFYHPILSPHVIRYHMSSASSAVAPYFNSVLSITKMIIPCYSIIPHVIILCYHLKLSPRPRASIPCYLTN